MPDPAAPTRPRRRWFRFSLRTLLVVTALVGLLLGWIVKERRQSAREMEIAKELEDHGWRVITGGPYDILDKAKWSKPYKQEWWQRWAENVLGRQIHELIQLRGPAKDFSTLAELSNLNCLFFRKSEVGNLAPLAGLRKLERIVFAGATAEDLHHLASITSLRMLNLVAVEVLDLTPLADLTNLESLGIYNMQIHDVTPLTKLKHLKQLRVSNASLSEEQIEVLQKALPNCKISHEEIQ